MDVVPRFLAYGSNATGADFAGGPSAVMDRVRAKGGASQSDLDEMARHALRALGDGGYTDDTGIAHAVAAGADELVAVLYVQPAGNDPYG